MVTKQANTSIIVALKDFPTLTVISYHLERYGYIINSARSTNQLNEVISRIEPNIIILDEDLDGNENTLELCKNIKSKPQNKNINIILVSKLSTEKNEFICDSICKPFAPSELVSKIKMLAKASTPNQKLLKYFDLEMNVITHKVSRLGKQIHLGPTEFKILQCLLELPERILSREHIMNYVWGYSNQVEQRTIDVHINRLRSALNECGSEIPLIKTVRALGYSLSTPRELVNS